MSVQCSQCSQCSRGRGAMRLRRQEEGARRRKLRERRGNFNVEPTSRRDETVQCSAVQWVKERLGGIWQWRQCHFSRWTLGRAARSTTAVQTPPEGDFSCKCSAVRQAQVGRKSWRHCRRDGEWREGPLRREGTQSSATSLAGRSDGNPVLKLNARCSMLDITAVR